MCKFYCLDNCYFWLAYHGIFYAYSGQHAFHEIMVIIWNFFILPVAQNIKLKQQVLLKFQVTNSMKKIQWIHPALFYLLSVASGNFIEFTLSTCICLFPWKLFEKIFKVSFSSYYEILKISKKLKVIWYSAHTVTLSNSWNPIHLSQTFPNLPHRIIPYVAVIMPQFSKLECEKAQWNREQIESFCWYNNEL